ncbi:hypothetical protein C8R46DRAFT_1205661 [Mycena filopes]|nr:hypothetical protein C8R46DRAFT_1205661 [Mycena filopes]
MERVQFQQEQMLAELKDLTALIRRVAKKADFLRYAAYEMGLEQLRRKRVERLKIASTQASISDYALTDVGLWIQYIDVAKREGAHTLVGRVVARAIQLHPDTPALYILAAAHELDHGSPSAARTLLQAGDSASTPRASTCGENEKGKGREEEEAADGLHADQGDLASGESGAAEARAAILRGGIVKSVIASAASAVDRPELFEALIRLMHEFPLADGVRGVLLEQVYGLLRGELTGEALVDAVERANKEMVELCRDGGEVMLGAYIAFAEKLRDGLIDESLSSLSLTTTILLDSFPQQLQARPWDRRPVPLRSLNAPRQSPPPTQYAVHTSLPATPPQAPSSYSPRPALRSPADSRRSSFSSVLEDVLQTGDVVGEGVDLQGETIRLVSPLSPGAQHADEPAREFEVVRRLGAGSYAVVYQVLEVLERAPPSEDGHSSMMGHMDFDGKHTRSPSTKYGREYAIKCLSKANLDHEALTAQMDEVTIHQSLHSHPNIVTLHRTLETSSFLLLILEYVPGEDLFYFLEQARDHYESAAHTPDPTDSTSTSRTPPTPSLLSTMNSRNCFRAPVSASYLFHRDIKPENFIVTDGFTEVDGRRERKVIVKLTDFGLSTTDLESSDMDCGSAPYMSYECRNNVAPSYRPRAADVWSLGIVLINMLYHYNPWTDTKVGACNSFDLFRQQPVTFFMQRFVGMTRPVAEHLAYKVFNVLDDPKDDLERISAADFGLWAKDLPDLLGNQSPGHKRAGSTASLTHGHRISCSIPLSHRPSSRQASGTASTIRTTAIQSRSLSRAGSFGPAFDMGYEKPEASELSTVIDQDAEEQKEEREYLEFQDNDKDSVNTESRSASTNKRRKRGARKGKGSQPPATPKDETLENLAVASQSLAREISRASRASSLRSTTTASSNRSGARGRQPFEPVSMYAMPVTMLGKVPPVPPLPKLSTSTPAPVVSVVTSSSAPSQPITKKPSKWKLSFGKSSAATLGRISPVEEVSPTDLPIAPADEWPRGRRARLPVPAGDMLDPGMRRDRDTYNSSRSPHPSGDSSWALDADIRSERAISPNSVRSGRPVGSSASSMVSGNWRSSTSSAGNASARSISTTATSISASSWRTNGVKPQPPPALNPTVNPTHPNIPKNVKIMNGVPWELDQLPRGQYPNPVGDIFGSPPVRQPRTRKPKDLQLGTIAERPPAAQKSPEFQRRDAATSTTDLSGPGSPRDEEGDGPKKVPKGQITALAKMLSALRR